MAAAYVLPSSWPSVVPDCCLLRSYEILSDPETREVYDMHGMAGLEGSAGSAGMNEADLFSAFFGSGMFGFGGPRRNQESVIPYETTLEDLYNGKSVKMNMEKEAVCGLCKGHVFLRVSANL